MERTVVNTFSLGIAASFFALCALASPTMAQAKPSDADGEAKVSDKIAADLREDAAHAWKFFERKSAGRTGIAPPNIWPNGEGAYDSYDIVTMWDVGSIVLATLSARAIDLIDDATFEKRIPGILDFIKRATYTRKGLKVPNFRSDIRTARSVEAGYDTTDTGRLFIALHILDKATNKRFDAASLFKGWNLDKTIVDGVMNDIKGGKFYPARSNIYRFYVSRAYDFWSVDHAAVYQGATPDKNEAARNAFLKELGEIGPIATEPSLVELIEVGSSPFAVVIADVLEKRQQERYKATGKLTSVSETPIDRDPWFTYQGLDLTREGEAAWTVYPYKTDKRWNTPSFAANNRVVNTKAAFLWFAARPSDYSEELWKLVRTDARSQDFGFHPGIFEKTGKPPANIDLNTNATILESIAYILNGRVPLSELQLQTNADQHTQNTRVR